MIKKRTRRVSINAFTQAQLIKLLLEGGYSCREMADETGLHYISVLRYCRELHRASAAHICGWDKDARGSDIVKLYKLGEGKDAKRRKQSRQEVEARYRAKKQALAMVQMMAGQVAA